MQGKGESDLETVDQKNAAIFVFSHYLRLLSRSWLADLRLEVFSWSDIAFNNVLEKTR